MKIHLLTATCLAALNVFCQPATGADPKTDLPLILSEDFEKGRERWKATDEKSWTHREVDGNKVFGINRRGSDYNPRCAAHTTLP